MLEEFRTFIVKIPDSPANAEEMRAYHLDKFDLQMGLEATKNFKN